MSKPNPFVPKGSLLEQQSQRRSRLKLAVFCVLAISVTGLVAMLIQGCKRTPEPEDNGSASTMTDTNSMPSDTSTNAMTDTNLPPTGSNQPVAYTPPPPPPVVDNTPATTEYVVMTGDTLSKIAKHNGVSLKALEAANPGVDSKHLKVKQKLVIPAPTKPADMSSGSTGSSAGAMSESEGEMYTVKAGDTLGKIAKAHGTTVKALEEANNLNTTKINVGKKLKIPGKAEAAPVAPVDNTPAAVPPAYTPVPASPPVYAPGTTN
jgi:LysM repeat protein